MGRFQHASWLYVEDYARALRRVFEVGGTGEKYNVGGNSERRNIDVVRAICSALDRRLPPDDGKSYAQPITFVTDAGTPDSLIEPAEFARTLEKRQGLKVACSRFTG